MVHVGMAQDHGVNFFGINRETTVAGGFFLTMTLKKSALNQQLFAVDFEKVHRAGGSARSAEKMDLHRPTLLGAARDVKK